MQPLNTCLLSSPFHHLPDTAVGHRTLATQPQGVCTRGKRILGTGADVAAQRFACPVAEECSAFTPSLAHDKHHVLVEVQVLQGDPDELSDTESRVQKQAEDRRVPSF